MKSTDIQKAYIGSTEVEKIYIGSDLIYQNAIDYSKEYFTIEPLADGTITFTNGAYASGSLSYSINKSTWISVTSGVAITVTQGNNVYLKGNMIPPTGVITSKSGIGTFSATSNINILGNVMSLLYGDNYIDKTVLSGSDKTFYGLFIKNKKVISAENFILPATTLTTGCYICMFLGCSSLTNAPELPATTLANSCYNQMFASCTSLTSAPELHVTTVNAAAYMQMFNNCTSLNYIKCLATDISAYNAFNNWVNNVASSGTFVKDKNTNWSTGANGIPSGWTVVDAS